MKYKLSAFIIIVIIFSSLGLAAEIFGKSYSPELEPLKNVVVEINTQPNQIIVTDPSYSFTVNPGNYVIKARYENEEEYYLEENITVKEEGKFSHDLILFYNLEDDDLDLPELDDLTLQRKSNYTIYIIFIIAAIIGFFSNKMFKRKSKTGEVNETIKESEVKEIQEELKDDLKQVLEILKDSNGRINQKDLRKQLNLSEAKVSLMVSELESLNKVKRIKKGRANIIVLN